jgi:hypothetical protein
MTTFFLLTFLASFPAAIVGLIEPRLVLPAKLFKHPTRKLALQCYSLSAGFSLLLAVWAGIASTTPQELAAMEPSPAPSVAVEPPAPKPAAAPSPSPAASPTIGVSRADIQSTFETAEVGFTFETTSPVRGLPTVMGKAPDDLALVQLIGQPEDLSEANLTIFVSSDDRRSNELNAAYSMGFLKLSVPGWDGHVWLEESLPRLVNGESEVSTVQSGKLVKATYARELGMINISVTPE